MAEFDAAAGNYIDVHAWQFTPQSFRRVIELFLASHQSSHCRIVAAKQVRDREQARKQKNSAAQLGTAKPAFFEGNLLLLKFGHSYARPAVERFCSETRASL